jgi:hypothetical protein
MKTVKEKIDVRDQKSKTHLHKSGCISSQFII